MEMTVERGRPSRLRRIIMRHRPAAFLFLAAVLSAGLVAQASAEGVTTECISDEVATDQNGGWNEVTVGSLTKSVQRDKGGTRRETLWQGEMQGCDSDSAAPCEVAYRHGEETRYRQMVNMRGGLHPAGGFTGFPIPFPMLFAEGSLKDETKVINWSITNTAHIPPGGKARPLMAVDYQERSGDFVGAYVFVNSSDDCNLYRLEPNRRFGNWHGEVATEEYRVWDVFQ